VHRVIVFVAIFVFVAVLGMLIGGKACHGVLALFVLMGSAAGLQPLGCCHQLQSVRVWCCCMGNHSYLLAVVFCMWSANQHDGLATPMPNKRCVVSCCQFVAPPFAVALKSARHHICTGDETSRWFT
jgi:hypothetical protein